AKIRDLLMMATMNFMIDRDEDKEQRWIEDFFTREANHMPGAFLDYNTSGSNTCAALVKRVTGKDFLEYMRPELDIMGIDPDIDCVKTPEGEDWSGSGVRATLKDFAKFGYLSLKRGNWFGQQLISEEYMKEATSFQIYNGADGYGYQFWMDGDKGFRLWGMGGQYAFCYPEKDLLIVTLGDTQGESDDIIHFAKDDLLDSVCDEALPADADAKNELDRITQNLSIVVQKGKTESPLSCEICGKTYELGKNPMKMKWIRFEFDGDTGKFIYENAQGEKEISFGLGKNVSGSFPQEGYPYSRATEKSDRLYDCYHSAAWVEPHKLVIRGWLIDRFIGNWTAEFSFVEDTVNIHMSKTAEYFLDEYEGFAFGHLIG
ncbi:MAG: serine hydrolase, partial [Ruminococcaceae bacterium]|nr:serine hydrolase [Oscillospiraceae bacterium]